MTGMTQSDIPGLLRTAIGLHQAGRLGDAEPLYRQVLARQPRHPDALHLLGLLAHHQGRNDAAVQLMSEALAVAPGHAPSHANLGLALQALGRLDEAEASYRRALTLDRQFPEAHLNLGNVLQARGQADEAIASYRRALQHRPVYAEAHYNLGRSYAARGQLEDAVRSYRRAVALRPEYTEAHFNLASALEASGQPADAIASYRHVLKLQPDYAAAHNNLGALLEAAGDTTGAIASYGHALRLKPDFAEAHNNLGNALQAEGRLEDALTSYRQALDCRPGYVDARVNRGNALQAAGRLDEAVAGYREVLALDPASASAAWNLAFALLLQGDYAAGWPLYEARWRVLGRHSATRDWAAPRWSGAEPLSGRTLLLHHEQGLGDTLQMLRYVPLLSARGARVVLEMPAPLARIAATVPGDPSVVLQGDALPAFDLHCPMMSLPLAFATTLDRIPASIPYLSASAAAQAAWQQRLGRRTRPRIGLAWSGAPGHSNDRQRSLPLAHLVPLLAADADFVSLQKEYRDADRPLLADLPNLRDVAAELGDFADTAGLITELDLVITVDTSVAHLAGALGKPVWLLLPFAPDYRWLLGREDSPWYPTIRLFRQPAFGDWASVIRGVRVALGKWSLP
jgi:tetratricopeptide (TPR) repeat protein